MSAALKVHLRTADDPHEAFTSECRSGPGAVTTFDRSKVTCARCLATRAYSSEIINDLKGFGEISIRVNGNRAHDYEVEALRLWLNERAGK